MTSRLGQITTCAEWNNSQLLREIDPDEIRKLKAEDGKDMLIYGSASLVQ